MNPANILHGEEFVEILVDKVPTSGEFTIRGTVKIAQVGVQYRTHFTSIAISPSSVTACSA